MDAAATKLQRVGAACWIVAPIQFIIAQIVAAAAWPRPYDWFANYISDLGNTVCGPFAATPGPAVYICSPLHSVMDSSFVIAGVLTVAGTILLWRYWPRRAMLTTGLVFVVINGLGKILVGFAPENVNLGLHTLGALNIPAGAIGTILIGFAIMRTSRELAIIALLTGFVGLVGFGLFVSGQYLGLGVGGMERVAEYPAELWVAVAGVFIIAKRNVKTQSAENATQ